MILFKGGTIIDGSGDQPFPGDILIEDEHICQIGQDIDPGEARVIDLTGRIITPGFIDAHSHNDWFCLKPDKRPFFDPFLSQGITTLITGNCGFSAFGCSADSPYISEVGGGLFHLSSSERYERCRDWLREIDGQTSLNVASLIGHGTARTAVAGLQTTELSEQQLADMLAILEQGLIDGAAGISLGLMYAPGLFAPTEELIEVARLCAKYDRILTIHPRAESAISMSYPLLSKSHLIQALEEIEQLVRSTGCRTVYSHLIFVGRRSWKDLEPALKRLERLAEDGYAIGFDMYPFHFGASVITVVLPDWYMKLSAEERQKPAVRLKLRAMVAVTTKLLGFGFSDMTIAYAGQDHPEYVGKTVVEIARLIDQSPFEAYLKICEDSDFKARVLMGSYQNDEIVERLMKHPLSVYMTDAWYEEAGMQNASLDQAFLKFLELGRKHQMPLEQVIHKMSGQTAKRYQLGDRGLLKPDYKADLSILNEDLSLDMVFCNGIRVYDRASGGLLEERHHVGQAISYR